ncbi:MAG: sulfate transporter [Prevotella sp.]|jgi:hypothetical protein|nr:sulfate transporter [Prevotella sp.]
MILGNFTYYLALLALIIIGVLVAKRIASCLVKTIITLILIAIGVAIYWYYLK